MVIVLMGPAGSGKTTVGQALAGELRWRFVDGDDRHPPANVEKMRAGQPLSDTDREPWLLGLRSVVARALDRREHLIVACSALKQRHRNVLAGGLRQVRFVFLRAPAQVLLERTASRSGHFAGPGLVDSQLLALEQPEDAFEVDATLPPAEITLRIRREFGL